MGKYKDKIVSLLEPQVFYKKIEQIPSLRVRAFNIALYYLGCRGTEARNITREDLLYDPDNQRILFDIHRLKHSKRTAPNPLYLSSPYMDQLKEYAFQERTGLIFPFSRQTGYNMVKKHTGFYPHYYRYNWISQRIEEHWTLADIRSWLGISARNIDFYLLEKKLDNIGKGLK